MAAWEASEIDAALAWGRRGAVAVACIAIATAVPAHAAASSTPAATLKAFFEALFANRGTAACALLGPVAKRELTNAGQSGTCPGGVALVASSYSKRQAHTLETMHTTTKTHGSSATITYRSVSNGSPVTFSFARAAHGWQISELPPSKYDHKVVGPL